jgi:hypothetical protein
MYGNEGVRRKFSKLTGLTALKNDLRKQVTKSIGKDFNNNH